MTNDNIPSTNDSITLLQEIAENSATQVRLQKKHLFWSQVTSALIFLFIIVLIYIYASVYPLLTDFTVNANNLILQFSVLLEDVSEVTEQLQALDLETSLNEVSALVTESSEKISELDVETLNQAIEDLSATVAPFAALFGR